MGELTRNIVPEQCSAGEAARILGISSEEVDELCVTGTLDAHLVDGRFWVIEEDSLTRYLAANPPSQPKDAPCPDGSCTAHWERRGAVVPEFRAGLCLRCYSGGALPMKLDVAASQD
jgi:hypothetical protein